MGVVEGDRPGERFMESLFFQGTQTIIRRPHPNPLPEGEGTLIFEFVIEQLLLKMYADLHAKARLLLRTAVTASSTLGRLRASSWQADFPCLPR
jgi:hypothetical protein